MKTELTEILKKHTKEEWRTLPNGGRELIVITDYDGAFKEYFDQQTEQLKKQLEEKEKEIRAYKLHLKQWDIDYKKLESENEQLQSQLSEKDKELSELKAKRKEEIISAFDKGFGWNYNGKKYDGEQYYTQTHGQ